MIEQTAKVLRVDNGEVYLQVQRQTACGSCSARSGCGKSLLDNIFNVKPLTFVLPNTINAREKDEVIIGLNDSALLQASFYLYFLPLVLMLVMAIVFSFFVVSEYSEIISILGAVVGLFAGSILSQRILENKSKMTANNFQPTLIKVIPNLYSAEAVFSKTSGV